MPSGQEGAAAPRLVRTTRLEAFSDGVFAIAITLLVLDLVIEPSGTPWERVAGAWPFYLAYVVSFLTIGAAWLGHTAITDRLAAADFVLLKINLLLLLVVAVLPFPTRLVAESFRDVEGERLFVATYARRGRRPVLRDRHRPGRAVVGAAAVRRAAVRPQAPGGGPGGDVRLSWIPAMSQRPSRRTKTWPTRKSPFDGVPL